MRTVLVGKGEMVRHGGEVYDELEGKWKSKLKHGHCEELNRHLQSQSKIFFNLNGPCNALFCKRIPPGKNSCRDVVTKVDHDIGFPFSILEDEICNNVSFQR